MLKFDDHTLINTAAALRKVNKYAAPYCIAELVESMRNEAQACFAADPHFGYMSTRGYVITLYYNAEGEAVIYASLNAATVADHFDTYTPA